MIIHFNIEKNEIQLNSSPIVGECMVSASVRWYFSLRRGYIWDDISRFRRFRTLNRAVSRLAANQWETSWQNNIVSRWLGANLESVQLYVSLKQYSTHRFVIYSIALPMVVYGTRWRHGMEKYSASLTLCEGNPPTGHRWIPLTKGQRCGHFFVVSLDMPLNNLSVLWDTLGVRQGEYVSSFLIAMFVNDLENPLNFRDPGYTISHVTMLLFCPEGRNCLPILSNIIIELFMREKYHQSTTCKKISIIGPTLKGATRWK